jgi:hypothetical protein
MRRTSLTRALYRAASISARGSAIRRSVSSGSVKTLARNLVRREAHRALGRALRGLLR